MIFRFITIFLFCVVSLKVSGQFTHPSYKQYTLRDGLSQMQVMCLFQDSRGYLWVGTKEGINCFNGDRIISFTDKDGLENENIYQIAEDFTGNIWASTNDGLACFDGEKWKSVSFEKIISLTFASAPDGKIWYLGTNPKILPIFGYLENGKYHNQLNLLPEFNVSGSAGIAYSKDNDALILHDTHNLYELKNGILKKLLSVPETLLLKDVGLSILVFETDKMETVNLFEYKEGKLLNVATIKNDRVIGKNRTTHEFTFLPNLAKNQIYTINQDTLIVRGFSELRKNSCLTDQDKRLWIGTEEGLYQVFSGGFETYKREFLPTIWSVVEDLDQNIWFASYDYGLKKFDGKTITSYSETKLEKYGYHFHFHSSVDKRGTLYFPNEKGIMAYNGSFFRPINRVGCLTSFYDRDRDLLWGGYRLLAEVYDRTHKLIRAIGIADGMEIKGYVVTIGKDKNGFYWLGGFTGLCRYNWDTKELINYNRGNGRLPADGVMSTFNTSEGRTWFGSTNGLLYYDNKTDSIRKIDREEISGTVSFVSAIDSAWLVFSQSTGIYLMDLQKFNRSGEIELHLFNEQNGFTGIDPGQDGALKDSKGNIWMTTSTEVVKLDPTKIDFKNNTVNVRISGINNKSILYNQKNIELPRNDRTAVAKFETICFNRPNPTRYSWKIKDRDQDWSPWQKEDYVVLTNLSDGESVLQVKAEIPGLPDSEVITSMPLVVSLSLWKKPWFFPVLLGIVSLLVIFALSLLFQARAKMIQINKQAKMFQLQAILSQMNPHFIFNVMASLQSMIVSANVEKANEYLVKLSNLVRGFLDASISTSLSKSKNLRESELPLKKELEILQNFIHFQQLIYAGKFECEIIVDPSIDTKQQTIPPMLIQPFVENAIRHGLLQKSGKGLLEIKISRLEGNLLLIEISDDGIGIEKSGELMRQSHLLYTSRGKELTMKRIKLLNEMGYNIFLDIQSSDMGTTVTIKIRYHDKV